MLVDNTVSISDFLPDNLTVGEYVNVNGATSSEPPKIRLLTKVETRGDWLYWYWRTEGPTPWGTPDCGYSGIDLSSSGWKENS